MPVRIELPPEASLPQRIFYPLLRPFFYFFFTYVPYYPVQRRNKPDLSGRYIWASSHSNFLCDTVPPSYEGPRPAKYLAKHTLFKFPIKGFLEFCGALPIARVEDVKDQPPEARSMQNRNTFKAAISAIERGWPLAIFPEGMSVISPGITLPLKPGVAKLGFAAEEAHGFSLGLRVIPVGLEYGSRVRVASGLTIHYGRPLHFADYREEFARDRDAAIRRFMADLTRELLLNYAHFQDEQKQVLGRKLKALGLFSSHFDAAQLFLRQEKNPTFWDGLEARMRNFTESTKNSRIPESAWGHRRTWKELGPSRRRNRGAFLFFGAPLILVDLINNSIPEFFMKTLVEYIAFDKTEMMSIRFIISPVVLGLAYALQFWGLRWAGLLGNTEHPFLLYMAYAVGSFFLWYVAIHWRRQFRRVASLLLFRFAGIDARSESVGFYRDLRQYLDEAKHNRSDG